MSAAHVYLVPGFFGFANLGQLKYFGHVRDFLRDHCAARGIDARVHVVRSPPTASLPRRATRLLDALAAHGGAGDVHLIGHSSGGLDARLLASPGVALPTRLDVSAHAARIRSVVTVATPHHGTPLASFFATRLGQQLLEVLSLSTIYVLRFGHLPLRALLQVGALFSRWDGLAGDGTLVDDVFSLLLGRFSIGRRRAVRSLFAEIAEDRALLVQLTPEAMEVFNAATADRPGVRYGSVVTRAAPAGLRSARVTGLDASGQALHAIYAALYGLATQGDTHRDAPLSPAQARRLRAAYGKLPGRRANDGIVPTRSQVWGEVIGAVTADHLDVIGHFRGSPSDRGHVDWLPSGSAFTHAEFALVWNGVLDMLFPGSAHRRAGTPTARPPRVPAARAPRRRRGARVDAARERAYARDGARARRSP